jgi:hypothetical protein
MSSSVSDVTILFILGFFTLLRMLYQGYQEKLSFATAVQGIYCIYTSTVHVSAFTGHHQVEHTI